MNKVIRIFFLVFCFAISFSLIGQEKLQLNKEGLQLAIQKAKEEHKTVFFMAYASWCSHCQNMKEKVFADPAVASYYNQHFICTGDDMEVREGIKIREKYKVKSFPTFLFIDSSGTLIYRMVGEYAAPEFLEHGKSAENPQKQLPFLKKQFESDVANGENCYEYLKALRRGQMDYNDIAKKYFATQSEAQLLTEVNWKIFANGITDIGSREFQFVLKHQKEYAALTSIERVERKIAAMVKDVLTPLVISKNSTNYFSSRKYCENTNLFKVDSILFTTDILFYEKSEDWVSYNKTTSALTDTFVLDNYSQLKLIASNYYVHNLDNSQLAKAAKWASRSLSLHEDYGTCVLTANLYRKVNDNTNALLMAKRAKEIAAKNKLASSDADKIISDLGKG